MYEDEWSRFMQTGQVDDYLAYKRHPEMENTLNKAGSENEVRAPKRTDGSIHEWEYAGIRDSHRDHYKGRTDW